MRLQNQRLGQKLGAPTSMDVRMRFLLLPALALAATPSLAAVSGFYDSQEQIQAIFASPDVADRLRQMPVEELKFEGEQKDGLIKWEVESRACDLDVFLRPVAPTGVGKTTYTVAKLSRCD